MKNNGTPMVHRIALKDRSGRVVGEKEVVSYAGLLDLAHKERLDSVDTTIIQLPTQDNGFTTIVRAVIRTSRGTYAAIGDASPSTVAPQIAPHSIRMAETRAMARALRTAVNIGAVAIEELGEDFDMSGEAAANDNSSPATAATPAVPAPRAQSSRASDQQRRYVYRLLQARGIEGERARDFVLKELGVPAIKDAPKSAVSALIDRLTANGNSVSKGASNGGGT